MKGVASTGTASTVTIVVTPTVAGPLSTIVSATIDASDPNLTNNSNLLVNAVAILPNKLYLPLIER